MSYKGEEYKLDWDELRLLIKSCEERLRLELSQVGGRLEDLERENNRYRKLPMIYENFKSIKERFHFDEKFEEWKKEQSRLAQEERRKKERERKNKAKSLLLEISKRYPRLLLTEITALIEEPSNYFMNLLRELKEEGKLNFTYVKASKSILFE